jgi:hypothetical protein
MFRRNFLPLSSGQAREVVEAVRYSETSVDLYQTAGCDIPEDM